MSGTIPFNVLSYNIFCPVPEPLRYYGQKPRASRVAAVVQSLDKTENIDAVIMNEVIAPECQEIIYRDMDAIGFRYRTAKLTAPMTITAGTLIFSKHPITMEDSTLFGDKCTGIDCVVAKGVNFARILKNHQYFNIFAVHMQAWQSLSSQLMREAQIQQMAQFIKLMNIPANEAVIFGGDLNIDLYLANDHLKHLMYLLHMKIPEIHETSYPFTVDPEENKLVGSDDIMQYQNDDFPQGCADEYFQTLKCPCCPEEWIDYTLYSNNHLQPLQSYMKAIKYKVPKFTIKISMTKEVEVDDVSDHYPVLGHFTFPVSVNLEAKNVLETLGTPDSQSSITLQVVVLVLIIVIFLLFVGFVSYKIYKRHRRVSDQQEKSFSLK